MNVLKHSYETLLTEIQLREALEQEEFRLLYQPTIDLVSGKIKGVEALIRWEHPTDGLISPLKFIPLAEETGLILQIGEWVLRTACKQNKAWQDAGFSPVIVAVNLSARQLYQPNLVGMVQLILEETGLAPEYLEIEITESMMMDVHHVLPILCEFKRIGIRISLDDFGTGYSSLRYLKDFPVDKIKIDQSFVGTCRDDLKDATIVKAIIAMAHQLKLEVTAEGIETKDQLIFLQQHLCNYGQGYLFSPPLSPEELIQKWIGIEEVIQRDGIPQELNRQKWLEEALEQARQELRETVRQQQGMIFKFKEQNGEFIHTLCDGELLYQIGLTPEALIGKTLYDVNSKEEAERKTSYYQRAWEGEEKVTYEAKLNRIWYLASLRPIRRGGQVVEVIASCVDITERKETEERYRKVVEFSPKGIIIHREGTILYANPSALKIAKEEDMAGKSIFTYLHPHDHEMIKQMISDLQEGNELPITELSLIRKDGEQIYIEIGAVTIPYDGSPAILVVFSDVTDRKRTEKALAESKERYQCLVNLLPEPIVVHSHGTIRYINDAGVKIFGYHHHQELLGKCVLDFYHPDDKKEAVERIHRLHYSKKHQLELLETKMIRPDGTIFYVEGIASSIMYKGEPAIQGIFRDNTARKKAEEALHQSEEKYRLIAENSEDLIAILDPNGMNIYASPSHERIFGFAISEIEGHYPINHIHPDDVEKVSRDFINTVNTKQPSTIECRIQKADGSYRWIEINGIPILNAQGEVSHVLSVGRDIEMRKQQDEALRQSEEKYRLIAENTQDVIGIMDTNGVVLYVSPSHKTVFGFSPNVYKGRDVFEWVHPEDRERIQDLFDDMLSSKIPCIKEFRYQHAERNWIYVEVFYSPVLDEQGQVNHIVFVVRDISERKRTEELIRMSEKLSVVGQLASGVAHEIRNPLTAIKGFVQLLEQEGGNPFYTKMILSEIHRLEDIVTEFLSIAKPQPRQMKKVDMVLLLHHLIVLFSTQTILQNVNIVEEYEADVPPIFCDENHLKQVFMNLLQNALEAMPNEGLIHVRILRYQSHSVQIRVIDQGCGISKERLKHIGEPFYSTKEKGTGLGLMISQKIIQEHGGKLYIESTLNQGTTVDVILPVTPFDGINI